MKPYCFRIGSTNYSLKDVTHNQLSTQAFQYIKSLSLDNKLLMVLFHDDVGDKPEIAVIVGDKIQYPFSSKLGPYEFVIVKKQIKTPIVDEMAVQHAVHYLEEEYNK